MARAMSPLGTRASRKAFLHTDLAVGAGVAAGAADEWAVTLDAVSAAEDGVLAAFDEGGLGSPTD